MYGDSVSLASRLVAAAIDEGRHALREDEAFQVVDALGIRTPKRLMVRDARDAAGLDPSRLGTHMAVVKVIAPSIAHKSEVGGVVMVENDPQEIAAAVGAMEERLAGRGVVGFSVAEYITYDRSLGGEWLLGMRWTDEFGPVVTVGAGGIATEFLASVLQPGRDAAVFSPAFTTRAQIQEALGRLAVTPLATGEVRRQPVRATLESLADVVERFSRLAPACAPDRLVDFEINPLVVATDGLVAVDVLALAGTGSFELAPPRPARKLRNLLAPASIAVMGVSERMNPGRIILQNLLREGFDRDAIHVIKPGVAEIDGCPAVPGIQMLPSPVDLLILSVSAAQVPEALIEATESRKAESVIVIPGGLEEKSGSEAIVAQMHDAIARSRATDWGGPVVNGGNCLGIQSRPGRYDTMFIPGHKLGALPGPESPLALISQSGAFAVSRVSKLAGLHPRYSITVGNQMDLTIADYLAHLETDTEVKVFALYVEGFKPLDGRAALRAVERITADGRTVILYRGGRTGEGAKATRSHTAAIAGDYAVTRDLFRAAGAVVAETLDDFTDLVMLFTLLHGRPVLGHRVGAVSNAGYECVAIADSLGTLELADLTPRTVSHLQALLEERRLAGIIDVHNPFDVTPMMDDASFEAVTLAMLDDPHVDVGIIGCVPATSALNTLPAAAGHGEDLADPASIAPRLARLRGETAKPFIVVVDAGAIYDPLAHYLLTSGVPTFRSSDRAMRLLNVFVERGFADTLRAQRERWVDEFGVPEGDYAIRRSVT